MLKEFKQFLLRGNVVDLAIGVVVGAAFTSVVNALVADIITPIISAIAKTPDFGTWYFSIGETRFLVGHLINSIISFVLVSGTIFFFIVKPMNLLIASSRKRLSTEDPSTKKCKECLSEIPFKAKRCSHCAQVIAS